MAKIKRYRVDDDIGEVMSETSTFTKATETKIANLLMRSLIFPDTLTDEDREDVNRYIEVLRWRAGKDEFHRAAAA